MSCHYGLSLIHLQDINFKCLAFEIQELHMGHKGYCALDPWVDLLRMN